MKYAVSVFDKINDLFIYVYYIFCVPCITIETTDDAVRYSRLDSLVNVTDKQNNPYTGGQ